MGAKSYTAIYRKAFATLGFPLTARDAVPLHRILDAERKLGVRLPAALREYYLVAGNERVLNRAHDRLYPPKQLATYSGKVVFREENQCAVVWGVVASSYPSQDPAVYQGPVVDEEPSGWYVEHRKCSSFLIFMLHMQATFGGAMKFSASGPAKKGLLGKLDREWCFAGEVNGMRAYSRQKQAVCFGKWRDFFDPAEHWRVFAGACDERGLQRIAVGLNLRWDSSDTNRPTSRGTE